MPRNSPPASSSWLNFDYKILVYGTDLVSIDIKHDLKNVGSNFYFLNIYFIPIVTPTVAITLQVLITPERGRPIMAS